ncbi:UNVERIFIED_CONTAM: hypothetical protein FKN15_008123 [Acipenser sinensis]
MDSVKMESVQIKEEFPELELVPIRVEFFRLASLPIKQELCEMQWDSSQPEVSEIKAEHNELEIPQTEEPLPVKQEEVLETDRIKQEPPEVEFDHMEPVKEESEDFKSNIPKLEPVRLRECSVVLARICVREQGAGEEGSPNSTQGGGKEDMCSHSECSLAAIEWFSRLFPEKKRLNLFLHLFDDVRQGPSLDRKGKIAMSDQVDAYIHQMVLWSRDRLRPQLTGWYSRRPWRSIAKGHGPIPSQLFVKVDAYVHQMVLWSRDRLRPQLTGWYSRRPWRSIAKGHGPIPSQLFVKEVFEGRF